MVLPTAARVRELLDYDPETGVFRWRVYRAKLAKAGWEAGRIDSHGRRKIGIDGRTYYAHRLAWLHTHGRWPTLDIDHRNGNPLDNRLENLREATTSQNVVNQRRKTKCASGFRGVQANKNRWSARVCKDYRIVHIGTFDTPEEAYAAYVTVARELHGEFINV